MVFIYGCLDRDPVIMLGQGLGLAIYARNLSMIYARTARLRLRKAGEAGPQARADARYGGGVR
jgi:lipid-A-disaccharide synthase-like uncharacterized protein